ncbi:hypothetical protein HOLleu_01959 [Holothuria leucospilota]|uniref:Uncharacterized protein n=1 Tax=Holothuria leucospilota TaxID=206669 RepID=A0A9Q1CQ05_HOLLE|nr:hypothetical protein HOLleu_01959 [Holothuria leucospilota]
MLPFLPSALHAQLSILNKYYFCCVVMGINVAFRLETIVLLCLLYESRAAALKSEPCDIKYAGMIKNVTSAPNPPRIAHVLKISGDLYARYFVIVIQNAGNRIERFYFQTLAWRPLALRGFASLVQLRLGLYAHNLSAVAFDLAVAQEIPSAINANWEDHSPFVLARDLTIIKLEGYVKDEETGFELSFRDMVCDLSETFCPVMKGEMRKLEYSEYLNTAWVTTTPFTVVANFLDEKGNFVASFSTKHCTIVKKTDGT